MQGFFWEIRKIFCMDRMDTMDVMDKHVVHPIGLGRDKACPYKITTVSVVLLLD